MREDIFNPWSEIIGEPCGGTADENGSDAPFWQTERGKVLRQQMEEVTAAQDEKKSRETAEAAERDRIQREAEQKAWADRRQAEKDEAATRERLAAAQESERLAAVAAEIEREREAREQASAALSAADDDFHVICINMSVSSSEPWDETTWSEDVDELPDAKPAEMAPVATPWIECFHSMGMIRADGLRTHMMGGISESDDGATFYAVCRTPHAVELLARLGHFDDGAGSSDNLTVRCSYEGINATRLFDALKECGALVAIYGGAPTLELSPLDDEGRDVWLDRIAIPAHALLRTVDRWEMSGRDPELFGMLGGNNERVSGSSKVAWLVDGRIARGVMTSVVANNQAGKSSLLHEWGAALSSTSACRARSILGQEVQKRYLGVLVFAEDPEGRINERAALHAKILGDPNYFVINASGMTLDEVLEKLRRIPRFDYVAIDPVRALMPGNEDSSEACNTFYGKLGALADERDCAVIVTHHLTKGHARYLSQMLAMVRGSGVHTDRPRMVIGMIYHRARDLVEIGPIKHNLGDVVWLPINQGQFYRWDRETSTSVLIDETAKASANSGSSNDTGPSILVEIARLNKLGILVRRSGKAGLFEMRLPGLAVRPRSAIVDGLRELLASGAIVDGSDGLQVRSPASDTP